MKAIFFSLLLANLVLAAYLLFGSAVPVAAPPARSVAANLELLSERPGRTAREAAAEEIFENPIVEATQNERSECQSLGPYEDIQAAQDVTERLLGLGWQVALRAVDERSDSFDYRVLIPPVPSLQDAFRKLRELKSRDIDSYVMSQGEDALGISLGVFSSRETAIAHRETMADAGYETDIREIPRIVRGYWIIAEPGIDFSADERVTGALVGPPVSLTERACLN